MIETTRNEIDIYALIAIITKLYSYMKKSVGADERTWYAQSCGKKGWKDL